MIAAMDHEGTVAAVSITGIICCTLILLVLLAMAFYGSTAVSDTEDEYECLDDDEYERGSWYTDMLGDEYQRTGDERWLGRAFGGKLQLVADDIPVRPLTLKGAAVTDTDPRVIIDKESGEVSVALIVISSILGIIAVVAIVWGLTVALAGPAGRTGGYLKQQSTDNRLFANGQFFDLKTDYDATVRKIPQYSADVHDKGATQIQRTNLDGIIAHCLDDVSRYEAASGKYLSKDFKDAGLPVSLDPTACKETNP